MVSKITFKSIINSLTAPEKTFAKGDYAKSSIVLLIILIHLLFISTDIIITSIMNRPELQQYKMEEILREFDDLSGSMSEEEKEILIEQIQGNPTSPFNVILQYVSLTIFSIQWLLFPLGFWGLQNIAARFLGGEELPLSIERKKGPVIQKHRRSLILSLMMQFPLAINAFASGIILLFRKTDSFLNVLSLEDLLDSMHVDMDLFSIFFDTELPIFLNSILSMMTNPFYWWMFIIAWFGMKKIWSLKQLGIVTILSLWLILNSLVEYVLLSTQI